MSASIKRRLMSLGRVTATRGRREVALFAAVYLLYDGARWMFVGNLRTARAHADWVIHLERSLHVSIEGQVQRLFDSPVASFTLSNLYLAAQLVVLPGALIWVYRRSPDVYPKLRHHDRDSVADLEPCSRCTRSRRLALPASGSGIRSRTRPGGR